MSNNIQVSNNFEPSTVTFSQLKKNKNGGKSVMLSQDNKKKLYLQLPFMRSPFGLSAFTDEATNKTSYSLDLSFDTLIPLKPVNVTIQIIPAIAFRIFHGPPSITTPAGSTVNSLKTANT